MKWATLLIGILTLPLLFNAVPLEILRLKTFDTFVKTPEPTGYFSILNITEEDIDKEGGYPLPRQTLAKIHNTLLENGALGVGWVVLFPHPDRLGGDTEFAQALQSSPSVIAMPEVPNNLYPETHGTVILGEDVILPQAQGFLNNIPILNQSATQGAVSVPVDVDNLVRQIPFSFDFFIKSSRPSLHFTSLGSIPVFICFMGGLNSLGVMPYSNGKNILFALGPIIFTVYFPNSLKTPLVGMDSVNFVESNNGISL